MKKILLALGLLLICPQLAEAQSQRNPCYYRTGSTTSCISVGTDNPLPVTGSISASLGGFHWEATLTPVSASTTPATTTITAGKTIVIQNIGSTNSAYCALGGTTSANATAVPPNSSVSLTSVSETSLTCVTSASTTTLNLQSGTGLWSNFGGGSSGGGGGGAVTLASGAVASGAYSSGAFASGAYAAGSIAAGAAVDGWNITQGSTTDAASSVGGTGSISAKLRLMTTQLDNINTNIQAPIPGGSISTTGNIAANNTTAVVVKASSGTLYGVQVYGIGSAPAYLKIYNATSATCGSGTPVKRLMIPAAATAANGAGSNITFGTGGVLFSTGITYCVTTGITDADTTAPAASTFLINLDWK